MQILFVHPSCLMYPGLYLRLEPSDWYGSPRLCTPPGLRSDGSIGRCATLPITSRDGMAIGREIVQRGRCQQYCLETLCDVLLVTVQVVKTDITPQLATSERLRAAKTALLHPAGQLHMRR